MKKQFSYDSPMMSALSFAADLVILNLVFLLCCIPVITIGPAQVGLYTALRTLQNPSDGSSYLKAFFRGFKTGFGTIFSARFLLLICCISVGFYIFTQKLSYVLLVFLFIVAVILMVWHNLLTVFHSRFQSSFFQLLLNCLILIFSHPLRAILACTVTWAPVVLFIWNPELCIRIFPLFFTVYFSLGYMLVNALYKKTFQQLIDKIDNEETSERPQEII